MGGFVMRTVHISFVAALLSVILAGSIRAGTDSPPAQGQPAPAAVEKCEHGVKNAICARCNPKLEAVFRAKGDWCAEHSVPESQCVPCHPELAEQGVK
jgi:hypothetical protein